MDSIHFILSTICIGVLNTCIDWFIIGYLLHSSQSATPQTWRVESSKSYFYSTLLSFLFGGLFSFFYLKIGSNYVVRGNSYSHLKLGLICFLCFTFITEINSAIYINLSDKFTIGKLIASCLTLMAAAVIAGMFYQK